MPKTELPLEHEARFGRIVRQTFLLPMIVMVVGSLCLAWLVAHLLEVSNWVDHTDQVIAQAQECEKHVIAMESQMRNYLLLGDPSELQSFTQAKAQVSRELDGLGRLVADNPSQIEKARETDRTFGQWSGTAGMLMANRRADGAPPDAAMYAKSKDLMRGVHQQIKSFVEVEYGLRQKRIGDTQQMAESIRKFRWVVLLVLGLGLGMYFARQLGNIARIYDAALTTAGQKTEALQQSEGSLREAEAKLREHAIDLEKTVAQRTAKLQETIADLEAYSYSISHDLRAPLRAMEGYARVLLEDYKEKVGPDGAVFLQRIVAAAWRMDKLIQDILNYSRVSQLDIAPEPVDLDKLTRDIVHEYPNLSAMRDAIQIESPLPRVMASEPLLTQCIANLLGNAIKFAAAGVALKVRVWAERQRADVRLWIEDNGIGIAPQYRNRIFGIFERIPSDSPREGMGIGLAIVRKAMDRLGGSVGVESEPGKGSKFWILLPGKGMD